MNTWAMKSANYLHLQPEQLPEAYQEFLRKSNLNIK